jgi:protein gp37
VADGTGIAWTDATWNPLRGCSRVSEGCRFCYAEGVAARFSGPGLPYEGLARSTPQGPRWTGKIRLVPEVLDQPLRWRRPRRIFVNSMSDLFHEDVPFAFIDRVFAVMALSYWHTFQVLTKRPARLREYLSHTHGPGNVLARVLHHAREIEKPRGYVHPDSLGWPYRNVWLGVSVEDQRAADERIPELLAAPAAVRFLSCEPLLGPVSLWAFLKGQARDESLAALGSPPMPGLDWVIVGGESGRGARLMDEAWARELVAQCRAASVPVFVKQLGSVWARESKHWPHGDSKGGDPEEWPEDLRVREMPEVHT